MLIEHSLLTQFPGIVLCKDKNSYFLGASGEFANLLGYKKPELVIGSSDYELPCDAVENAAIYIKEDRQVMEQNQKLAFLQICRFADGLIHALYYEKAPLINLKNNELTGVICQGFAIKDIFLTYFYKIFSIREHGLQVNSAWLGNYIIEAGVVYDAHFSEREMECLFYLLRGKSAKEIAKNLAISPRTVETYIENLKSKTHSQSKAELIDFCFQNGYQNKIPKTIFRRLMNGK